MKRAAKHAVAAGLAALWAGGALAQPKVTAFHLENGMTGVVIEDHRAPAVTHMIWYPVGSADEEPGAAGVAHFLEHLMFKGALKAGPDEFSARVAAEGGEDNAMTTFDFTTYYQRVAPDRLEMAMELEADRMKNLRITPEAVDVERRIVMEERLSNTESLAEARLHERMRDALYKRHPYGDPIIGSSEEIAALTREKAMAFYKKYYAPDHTILVVAGDVAPAEVERLARKYYGPIAASGFTPPPRPEEPTPEAPRRVEMSDPMASQPLMRRTYVSAKAADVKDTAALRLAAQILAGGANSRLHKRLLAGKEPLAVHASAANVAMRDMGMFDLGIYPADGASQAAVEAAIDSEIARFAKEGPTEQEMKLAKTILVSADLYEQDQQFTMAHRYGAFMAVGLSLKDILNGPDLIRSLTPEDVRAAVAKWLTPARSVTGWLEPADYSPANYSPASARPKGADL